MPIPMLFRRGPPLLHALYCTSSAAHTITIVLLRQISATLKKEYTAIPIYYAIMKHLYMHINITSQLPRTQSHIQSPINALVGQDIQDKTTIWWSHFFKYRLSKHQSTAHTYYYSQCNNIGRRTYTTLRWQSRLMQTIIGGCIVCLEKRNTTLHSCTAP